PQPLPYVAPVMGGLRPGMAVCVQGLVPPHADRFRVNLASGPEDEADLALHLNPRFGAEGQVVLNSRFGGQWGPEQCRDLQAFVPGTPFEIVIAVTPQDYRVRDRVGGGWGVLCWSMGAKGAHWVVRGVPKGQ
uniref:Galectin n=1 Tax=Strix occidentalis caurina TaxID=311401 RepID=A0A8D0FZ64_STROC